MSAVSRSRRVAPSGGSLPSHRVSRAQSLNTITAAISAPARATTSHMSGAALPNGANSVVKITGSGFHVGPPVV